MLEQDDWQAPMPNDLYFLHTASRVAAQSGDMLERGQDTSGDVEGHVFAQHSGILTCFL